MPTRDEVWSALMRRVYEPAAFVPNLTICPILSQQPQRVERELRFGQATILDVVSIDEQSGWLRFEVAQTTTHAGGVLTITIEEAEEIISLRFAYGTTLQAGDDSSGVDPVDYVKAAYAASDRDTVEVIRGTLGYDFA